MNLRSTIILALSFFIGQQLFAHTMWIETAAKGSIGKQQEIKIYFGEIADKDITPTERWFSDIKDFTLTLITPDKQKIKLSASANKEYYSSFFTPAINGVYTLIMQHMAKDVYGKMKLNYNSSATVAVGDVLTGNDAFANSNIISLFAAAANLAKQNTEVSVLALYDSKPAVKQKVKVFAPNGWGKELYSNEKGEVSFTPLWAGKYMVEISYSEKIPGGHNGKKYEEVYKMATYVIDIQ